MARDCTHPKNYAMEAARKIEYYGKNRTPNYVNIVLAHLYRKLYNDKNHDGN